MTSSETLGREWVLEPSEQILAPGFLETLSPRSIWTTLLSTLFSLSLAKTLWNEPLQFSWKSPSPLGLIIVHMLFELMFFFYGLFVIQEIVRLVAKQRVPFRMMIAMGVVALLPLHLMLPISLICRPFGDGGEFIFQLANLAIWVVALRRLIWGVEHLFGWPSWAASLVVFSPALLSCAMLFVAASMAVMSFSLAFLTLLG